MRWEKVVRISVITILIFIMTMSCASAAWSERAVMAHDIAEKARVLGLSEDNPIIVEAQRIWWEEYDSSTTTKQGQEKLWYTDDDVRIVATVIFNEAGYGCTERHMELVGAVLVNRVHSDKFPNTVYDVVCQPHQYLPAYANANSYYTQRAQQSDRWSLCVELAKKALNGEVECPNNVVFQANFVQGHGGGYERCYTSYSVTYFCYC